MPGRQTESDSGGSAVKRRPSMFTSALSNWCPLAANILIGLLLTPFLIAQLGKTDFGIWSLVISFVGYYGLLRLSVGSGIMRYVPFYAGRRDHKAASQIICTGLAMFMVVGVAILLISTAIAGPVARFYRGGRELELLIRIMGVAAAVECPMRIFDATLRAQEKWIAANVIATTNAILYATGLATCLILGYGLIEMGVAVVVSTSITLVLAVLAVCGSCPEIHLGIGMVKLGRLRELFTFGILTVVGTMAHNLPLQNHKLIIGKLVSLEAIAVYAVAVLLIEKVKRVVWAPLQVAWPRFALLDGQNNHDGIVRLFQRTTRYSGMLSSGIILVVLLAGPSFITLWVGRRLEPEDIETAQRLLAVLAIGCLVESTLYTNGMFLGGTGRQKVQAILSSIEAVGGFALSLALGWQMGLVGVAWGFTAFVILIRGVISTWYVCHLLKMSLIGYYAGTLLRPWLILGIIAATGHVLGVPTYANRWISWLALVVVLTGLYSIAVFLLVLNSQERGILIEKVRRIPLRIQILVAARKQTT